MVDCNLVATDVLKLNDMFAGSCRLGEIRARRVPAVTVRARGRGRERERVRLSSG